MKRRILLVICLCLVVGINFYFRTFPINFPQLKDQSKEILEQGISEAATQEVYKKFPQYDPLAKEKLIKTRIAEYKKNNKESIDRQTQELYEKLKSRFQDEHAQTYIMELDCWHWSRYVENVVNKGHPGDEVRDGKQYDNLMLAPEGDFLEWDQFLYYFSAFLYKIFSLIKSIPLFTFLFYLPLLYSSVFIIVLFLFSFYHGKYIAGIISCLFIGLYVSVMPRSCAGWFDKDILTLLFPLLVAWPYLRSYTAVSLRRRFAWVNLSGFFVGLFCFTWTFWWFIFLVIVAYEIISLSVIGFLNWRYKKDNLALLKQHSISLIALTGFSLLWVIIFSGFAPLVALYNQIKDAILLSNPVETSIWPNVYSTVGELKKMNLREISGAIWGVPIFAASVISMLIILARNLFWRKDEGFKRESIIIFSLWFVVMLYACLQGIRFLVYLTIPLGISLGWFINDIYEYYAKRKHFWKGSIVSGIICIILGCVFISSGNKVAKSMYPLINAPWFKCLNLMKETTPKGSVINSWWDFGDWFKVIGQRRVIFDGQSQNKPQAFWMAKALLSGNEDEALGILRMLNNGANEVYDKINDYLKDPLRSMLLLESIIPLEPGKAKEILLEFLPPKETDEVLILLFDKPGSAYFVVDYSMISKIGAISYLGGWNFSKVYMVQNFNKKEKDQILDYLIKLGRNQDEMQRLYQEAFLISGKDLDSWISHPLQFYSGVIKGHEKDGNVFFDNGFIYNPQEKTIYSNGGQVPRSLFIQRQDGLVEVVYPRPNLIFSVLVFQDKEGYKAVFLDRELANSLFVKLYFLKGWGLNHFKLHIEVEDGDNFIGTYAINW